MFGAPGKHKNSNRYISPKLASVNLEQAASTEEVKRATNSIKCAQVEFKKFENALKNPGELLGNDEAALSSNTLTPAERNKYDTFWKISQKADLFVDSKINLSASFDKLVSGLKRQQQPTQSSSKRNNSQVSSSQTKRVYSTSDNLKAKAVKRVSALHKKATHSKSFLDTPSQSDTKSLRYYLSGIVKTIAHSDLQLVLNVSISKSSLLLPVFLEGMWRETNLAVENEIQIVWSEPKEGTDAEIINGIKDGVTISDSINFLILNPKKLISPTRITEGITCLRRAYMSNYYFQFFPNKSTVMGILRHSLVEVVFLKYFKDKTWIDTNTSNVREEILSEVLYKEDVIFSLFSIDSNLDELLEKLNRNLDAILKWLKKFATSKFARLDVAGDVPVKISLKRLNAAEEKIWSTMWGLKGQLDLVGVTEIISQNNLYMNVPTPIELKTGFKIVKENYAQVILYKALIQDRYCNEFERMRNKSVLQNFCGVLLHLKDSIDSYGIAFRQHQELAWLIHTRNAISQFISKPTLFPNATGNRIGECSRCYQRDSCILQYAMKESGTCIEDSIKALGLQDVKAASELLTSVNESSKSYFSKHLDALNAEEEFIMKLDQGLESLTFTAFLTSFLPTTNNSFLYTFQIDSSKSTCSVCDTIKIGAYVIVGYVGHQFLLSGYVISQENVSTNVLITVKSSSNIATSCGIQGWQQVVSNKNPAWKIMLRSLVYSNFKKMRGNLLALMSKTKLASNLRPRIFGEEPPVTDVGYSFKGLFEKIPNTLKQEIVALTPNQKKALKSILSLKNYTCVQGLPGCGKTTVLSLAIRILSIFQKRILITSYTHNAVDTLLSRVQNSPEDFNIVRLQSKSTSTSEILLGSVTLPAKKIEECRILYKKLGCLAKADQLIVGVTALSVHNPFLQKLKFDYCFVDEASQINDPTIIAPLLLADKFVLVGDHHQLAPLTRSKEAKLLSISLLRRLFETYNDFPVLRQQFRMVRPLLDMNNSMFQSHFPDAKYFDVKYFLSDASLYLPYFTFQRLSGVSSQMQRACDPDVAVNLIDVNNVDDAVKSSVDVLNHFYNCGLSLDAIAILCVYNKIVSMTQTLVRRKEYSKPSQSQMALPTQEYSKEPQVSTVDKFQGQERDIIVLNLIHLPLDDKSNKAQLLSDWRRLYVAFSRCRKKLVVLGDRKEFLKYPALARFTEFISQREKIS